MEMVKIARCEMSQAVCDARGVPLESLRPCGQVAGPAPDGEYLCADHMEGWYCEHCGAQHAAYQGPYRWCQQCG